MSAGKFESNHMISYTFLIYYKTWCTIIIVWGDSSTEERHRITDSTPLPPLRHAVDDLDVLVTGKAEADEPLLVQQARRLLQQLNPPSVVLDHVVVGGEDGNNAVLRGVRRYRNFNESELLTRKMFYCRTSKERREMTNSPFVEKKVEEKFRT